MEFLNWKNILLEWANRLNYLGRAHYSLNMVEIEAFYGEFRTNVTSKDIASKKLDSFMTSYFPEFHPSWTNEGKMSPDDYVFGFSLLMYFACVKHPDVNIQRICKEMQEESQLVVGTFLKNLLDSNSFSRETIKCVIESSAPAKLSDYVLALSPTKISETNMCLATPKSKILNEWNAENRQLRAQVDTERFERGFLETLLKKKEEEISDLHQERRKFQADIQQLKSKLTDKDTENIPVNYNDSQLEMLKRRLRKDIADKDAEISKLQTKVDDLTTAKQHFAEKLSLVESQYNNSIECSAKLADKLEQLTETCDKQQEHIKGLEINIKEYQKYFNESSSKGNSLETSSDNLEDSFALAMASLADRSTSSPENMGQVVDMQLREQIALYESLQEKCIRIEEENSQLREQMEEHIQRTSVLELQCREAVEENKIIAQRGEKKSAELTAVSEELNLNATKLQALRSELDSLTSTVNENHQTIEILNEAKSSLEQQLNVRENEVAGVRVQLEAANTKLETAESMRLDLVSQHDELLRQKDVTLAELETEKQSLSDQLNALTVRLSNAEEIHETRQTQMETEAQKLSADLRKTISDCQTDRDSLQQTVADLTEQIAILSAERQTIDSQLADLTSTNEQVVSSLAQQLNDRENEVAVVRIQLEAAKAKLEAAESMRSDLVSQHEKILRQKDVTLAEFEAETHSLTDQLSAITSRLSSTEEIHEKRQTHNAELVQSMEKKAETLDAELRKTISELADCQTDRDSLQQTLADLTEQIAILSAERQTVDSQLADLTSTYEQKVSSLELQLNVRENEVAGVRVQLEAANAKLETAESMRLDLVSQHEEILRQKDVTLAELEAEKHSLTDQLSAITSRLSNTEEIHEKRQTQNAELVQSMEKKAETLDAELRKTISELADCQTDRDSLQQTLADLTEQIAILSAERQTVDSQLADLTSTYEQKVSSLELQLNVRENEVAGVRVQLEAANAKLETAESMRLDLVSQHEEILRQKDVTLAELEAEKHSLTDQLSAITSRLSNTEEIHEKRQTQNAELVQSMEKKAETLDAELRKTISELADCQTDRDSLQQTLADLTEQIAILSAERQTVDSKLTDLTSTYELKVSSLELQLNVRENEVAGVRVQLEAANAKLDTAESMRSDLVSQQEEILRQKDVMLAELETEKHSLTDQLNALTSRLSNAEETHEKSQTQNAELIQSIEKEAERLDAELRKTISELVDCQTDRDSLQQNVADLTKQIAILSAERQTVDSQLADLTSTNEQLMSDRDQLRDKLTALETERIELEARLNTIESSRADLEAQLMQSEDEKEKLFLNLQEKIDEAEATELTVKEWSRRCENEAAKYETAVKANQLACEEHEKQISDLTNAVSELTAGKDNLTEVHSDLRKEASHMRMELETMRSEGEQHTNEKRQLLASIEELTVAKNAHEAEVRLLQQKLNESNDEYVKLVGQCNALETANSSKADAEIEELKLSITELTVQKESLSVANAELSRQLSHSKTEFESYQRSTDYKTEIEALVHSKETLSAQVNDLTSKTKKLAEDLAQARRENVSLTDENIDLATEIEKVRTEYADSESSNRDKINSLKSELNRLETANSGNHRRIDELQKSVEAKSNDSSAKDKCAKLEADLQVALADLETKIQECRQGQEAHAQLVHDNKILSAKLTQHRKLTVEQEEAWLKERTELMEQREKSCTEIRFELEGKLSKMKERMKHIYNEETSRSKEKQEKQERELTNYKHQCQLLNEKIEKYVAHVQSISTQLYKLNEQILELKKENEFLKSKLRLAECNPRESRLFPPPNFGSNLKIEMEDELGEVFNNTYLADLKSGGGRTSPVGRESIRQSELRQRNSMAARHLRSTYAAQYGDQNLKEEDISMPYFNDSMFSNQLDVRRGTLYQRPGPPTPSKNGGRLSFGGSTINASDLFPKDILREQNTTAKTKTTPGKLMSMFSSSKHKELEAANAKLETVESMRSDLVSQQEEILRQKGQTQMEKDTEELDAELRKTINELTSQTDRHSFQQTVADLTDQITILSAERQTIDSQLADLTSINEQVMSDRDQLRDELTGLETENIELEARLNGKCFVDLREY